MIDQYKFNFSEESPVMSWLVLLHFNPAFWCVYMHFYMHAEAQSTQLKKEIIILCSTKRISR